MEKLQIQFDSDGYHLYKVAWNRYLVEHEGDEPLLLGPADVERWAEDRWPDRVILIDGLDEYDSDCNDAGEVAPFNPSLR